MSKVYRFSCVDTDDDTGLVTHTSHEFETNGHVWSGFDGPMYQFHLFLKGLGYVYGINDQIGIMGDNGEFTGATDE